MSDDQPATDQSPPKSPKRRLRVLLAVVGLGFGLFFFTQLDRTVVSRLGPSAEAFYDAFQSDSWNQPSAKARRFVSDVKELGGEPRVVVESPGFLGVFGRSEEFKAVFRNKSFDDAALKLLSKAHGDRVVQLVMENTSVTPAGLGQLHVDAPSWLIGIFNYP